MMNNNNKIRCIQINLHRAKAASAVLQRRFIQQNMGIGFVQEPWTIKDRIKGLSYKNCKLIYSLNNERPRAALMLNSDIACFPLTEFLTRDLASAVIEIPTERGTQKTVVASVYFPPEERHPPPPELVNLVEYCRRNNTQIIIGCDANAHHIEWGSSDTRDNGEYLLEFINLNKLEIVNRGNMPTYRHEGFNREEVIDLTLASSYVRSKIKDWHVSNEPSMSDHRHICFELEAERTARVATRIPRRTDWNLYKERLAASQEDFVIERMENSDDLDIAADKLNAAIHKAYEDSCPATYLKANRNVPWWSRKLEKMRKEARRLENVENGREEFKAALTAYNKEIRRSKRRSWRRLSEEVKDTPAAARLRKILSKDHSNGIGTLRKADGSRTSDQKETLETLMKTHFPESHTVDANPTNGEEPIRFDDDKGAAWRKSKKIFTRTKVKWAINKFKPYKSPGPDQISPIFLQKGIGTILPTLVQLFRTSYTLGYLPVAWRRVRVVFIPKAGRRDAEQPKSYRPISLTSFLLKTMERIIDLHIRLNYLNGQPLHPKQFAFQTGRSTVSALHHLVKKIENAVRNKETALATFIDVEGAFDNTGYDSIRAAAERRHIEPETVEWIIEMLECRIVMAQLGEEGMAIRTTRGCPQGGVLSPLLWSLVIDELLTNLEDRGYEVIGFADDLVIIVRGKDDSLLSDRIQSALNYATNWCRNSNLNINPKKTVVVPFTRRHKHSLRRPVVDGVAIEFSAETKYLGVILDRKLLWNSQIVRIKERATNALMACKGMIGQRWGLKPSMMQWLYTVVVRPMLTYASFVWWQKADQKNARKELQKVQRLACLLTTGAMRSAPNTALEVMLDLPPLPDMVKKEAAQTAFRMLKDYVPNAGDMQGHMKIYEDFPEIMELHTISDVMPIRYDFDSPFEVIIPERNAWEGNDPGVETGAAVFYTDGSRKDGSVGIGAYGPSLRHYEALGTTPTIFQAEMYAIMICAKKCLSRGDIHGRHIYIMSDSQAALKALRAHTFVSKLVSECLDILKGLSTKCELTLMWVPGHTGIEGNEIADELANKGAESHFIGPEPFFGYNGDKLRTKLLEWLEVRKRTHFETLPLNSLSRRFLSYSKKRSALILATTKTEMKTLTGILTGHCGLKYHMHRIGKCQEDLCRLCMEESETAQHILCECAATARIRLKYFGNGFPDPSDIRRLTPRKILNYLKDIDLEII
jgi:ribonuclease HI